MAGQTAKKTTVPGASFAHHYVRNEGVRLHYVTCGTGRPILFLHGFPELWYAWKAQLLELGKDHETAALDMRGYSRSDKPEDVAAYEMNYLMEDVRRCLGQLVHKSDRENEAVLVGHDWGGVVAWFFASHFPSYLSRLVIINAPHPGLFAPHLLSHPRQMLASSYVLPFQLPGLAARLLTARNYALLKRIVFGMANPGAFSSDDRRAYLEAWSMPHAITGGLNYYRANSALRWAREEFPRIDVPTLVIWGEKDRALLESNLDGLERFVSHLTIHKIPNGTHWVAHEYPDAVSAVIRAFLD